MSFSPCAAWLVLASVRVEVDIANTYSAAKACKSKIIQVDIANTYSSVKYYDIVHTRGEVL